MLKSVRALLLGQRPLSSVRFILCPCHVVLNHAIRLMAYAVSINERGLNPAAFKSACTCVFSIPLSVKLFNLLQLPPRVFLYLQQRPSPSSKLAASLTRINLSAGYFFFRGSSCASSHAQLTPSL